MIVENEETELEVRCTGNWRERTEEITHGCPLRAH